MSALFRAIVLAGERPGGGALARALQLPAAVLAPLAGRPCLERVLDTLADAERVEGIKVCGPAADVVQSSGALKSLLARPDVTWLAPQAGPAASALAGARAWDDYPLLLTAGDHGLLDPAIVDGFCEQAWQVREAADVVVGLVSHDRVAAAFPQSRRTVLRFADGAWCGSNLFALLRADAVSALRFWTNVEAQRKRPWRIARRLGTWTLLRYALRRLTARQAFAALSKRAGCRITWVPVHSARAAVDVDSEADWRLADRLLRSDAGSHPADCAT